MVRVVIGPREFLVTQRVAELLERIAERWERLSTGSKTLRAVLRKEQIRLTIEEEV